MIEWYLSVCSGIEAATVAFEPLGWKPLAFSEIDPFPRAVLQHHYPEVPLYGDFTKLRDEPWIVDADMLVGGTPCQAFSVAGLRQSLDDDRGNLTLEYVRLANAIDDLRRDAGRPPVYCCWENVPGVLSTHDNAFGAFLAGLCGCDAPLVSPREYGWSDAGVVAGPKRWAAWRILDAQYHGLAQRRRRVFVLSQGGAGGWRCADALLPIVESVRWNPPPRREAGKSSATDVARSVALRGREGGGTAELGDEVGDTLRASTGGGDKPHALIARASPTLSAQTKGGGGLGTDFDLDGGLISRETAATLTRGAESAGKGGYAGRRQEDDDNLARQTRIDWETETFVADDYEAGTFIETDVSNPTTTSADRTRGAPIVSTRWRVRRLTPTECERLQGFPDGYTSVPFRKKPASDGPRYKALGNSMACNVMRWIGTRIQMVEESISAAGEALESELEEA